MRLIELSILLLFYGVLRSAVITIRVRKNKVQFSLQKHDNRIAVHDFAIKLQDAQIKLTAVQRHLMLFNLFHQHDLELVDFFKIGVGESQQDII